MTDPRPLLLNGIRCPDGTEIFSRNRHDYVTHDDANGETYMVDGGLDYLRGSVNVEPAEPLHQHLSMVDHEHNREHMHWGSRGIKGDQPLIYKPLKAMTTDHIEAILRTQKHIEGSWMEVLFERELVYRGELGDD